MPAVGFAYGADAGLTLLQPLLADTVLQNHQPLRATHVEFLRRAGDLPGAAREYERASALFTNVWSVPSWSDG